MRYFLGIDVGSSKTHALLADETGRCLGFGKAGGGNHQVAGYDGLEVALRESFKRALKKSPIQTDQIAGAGFGVAGYDFPSDRRGHLQAITALELKCPFDVVNDGVIGLLAGATHGVGVNVTAGSGVNCRGRGRDGREGRIVGNGSAFGEYGGAAEIVERGLHLVNYAWMQRIPPTALTQIYLDATGAQDELDLMEGLSNWDYQLESSLAPEIFKAAEAGDQAARGLVRWAGEELGWLAVAVARQIGMQNEAVEIIQSGSVFEAGEIISAPMREVILQHCPRAVIIRLEGPPVVGALLLGMEQAGFDGEAAGYPVRETLIESARQIIKEK